MPLSDPSTTALPQSTLETLYSGHNVRWIIASSIAAELDNALFDWTLYSSIRLDQWLQSGYDYALRTRNGAIHTSKCARIECLKPWLQEHGLNHLLTLIATAVLHTGHTQTYQQVIGYLAVHLPYDDPFAAAQTAAELLAICHDPGGLYAIYPQGSGRMTLVSSDHWDLLHDLFGSSYAWINETGFNLPLVAPPVAVTDNTNCGYHTLRVPLLLGHLTRHQEPQDLACINTLNAIQWLLDEQVLAQPEQVPDDFELRSGRTRAQFIEDSARVYQLLGDRPFWLAWQYDFRGRIYDHGYHVHFQSYGFKKAALSFNKFEYLS